VTPFSGRCRTLIASTTAAAIAGIALLALPASAAPSATTGLFGSADPTFDGVFRQSLAILGLDAIGARPAPKAITWLLNQQCPTGAFQAYRLDATTPCAAPDPKNFAGPDTNSTAMAMMALMSLQIHDSASTVLIGRAIDASLKASNWLVKQQAADGGWPWTSGGASDANSTGLSLAALLTMADSTRFPAYAQGSRYLGRLSSACAVGGGLAYQSSGPANGSATAQALLGLAGTLPVTGPRKLTAGAPCANNTKAKAASYLAYGLATTGTLASAYGDGPDYSGTATAVLGLVSAGQGRVAVAKGTAALKAAAPAFSIHSGAADPGAIGLLLLVAEATGSKPTSFGGVNLVSSLTGSLRK
jgi:hypothetical protein